MSARTRQSEAKSHWLRLVALWMMLLCPAAWGQTRPATQPATRPEPATEPVMRPTHQAKDVARWFAELVHPDAPTRVQAMTNLMALEAGDLPTLRQVVKKNQPLAVAQASALRQIVTQIFLASETYDVGSDQGFLGIFLPSPDLADSNEGALVSERMPGFVSMRMFRDGDVILSVQLAGQHGVRIHSASDLTKALTTAHAGNKVHFELLRQGQILEIAIQLDPRPVQADIGIDAMKEFNHQRLDRADAYWEKNFAALLHESVSFASPPPVSP